MNDLPLGWEIEESVETTYNIPDYAIVIHCANKEIAEKEAQRLLQLEQENKQLKEEQDIMTARFGRACEQRDNLKQKLEKIKESDYKTLEEKE